ncbi:MAG: RNA polymerase sigma factor [Chitinophagales bacterium]|jgi:RNA polymerase sigma factor (sigma-70 family)
MEKLVEDLQQLETKESAFKVLMELYQKRLYFHIYRYLNNHDDTNDVLQNTFIKVWRNIENFRNECTLYSWLYRIAGNEAITFINSNTKRITVDVDTNNVANIGNIDSIDGDKIELKLQAALEQLPEKQKQIFILRYYDEMPYKEMSEILETSEGALKASYHHAAKKIETFLLEH